MFKNFKINKLLFFAPLLTLMFCFNASQNDDEKMQTIMMSVRNTLYYLHYAPKTINDSYSVEVYEKYMESLDPGKRFFLQSEVEAFDQHKTKLDDYLNKGDLTFYKLTIDKLYARTAEIEKLSEEILSQPINFEEKEEFILERKLKKYPRNQQELRDEWKKFIKYNILQEIETLNAKEEAQKEKKDSVNRLQLKDTIKLEILTPQQKQIKATEEVKDLMSAMFKRFQKRKKMNWFSVYMNAYTEVFDPHTNYFSPQDKEDFDVNFVGKVIGIGATIMEKRGKIVIGTLVVGAPAWKSKQISEGDEIIKVKSKKNEDPTNVTGMLSDEAVRLIRGEKGTEVVLILKKKDGSIKEVKMIREEVTIEDTFARSIVINAPNGKKYGFINLPSFNADFEDANGRNASDDIKNELLKLKAQQVDGVVLDLRNNGGGSLTEVVDIMGLFMNNGPVVQVKDGNGKIQVLKNKQNAPIWTGPLVIMQNELSASASEILAGAMKDYGRAVIVGSPSSFGKGTVQTFVELNRILNTNEDFGALKLTIQKFYRINGTSTQLKGVESDIPMKDVYSYEEIGERYDRFALPWDQLSPTLYAPLKTPGYSALAKNSLARLSQNKNYQLLLESALWKEKLDKEEKITLHLKEFEALMKLRKAQIEKFKTLLKYNNGLSFAFHADESQRMQKDEVFAKKSENWMKNLKRDLYLQETVHIISEMK